MKLEDIESINWKKKQNLKQINKQKTKQNKTK